MGELRLALVARENQLAANLLAAMLKANVRLRPVTLGQKWVSGHINIHCSEKDEESEHVLTAQPKRTFRCINTHARSTAAFLMMRPGALVAVCDHEPSSGSPHTVDGPPRAS